MGTALEAGLAIPHARFQRMLRPIIVFGRSRTGVEDWDSPDGQDTHFVFLVLAPPYSDAQVQILGHIVGTMQEPDIREQLIQAENTDAIWRIFSRVFASKHVVRAARRHRRPRTGTR
jgi:mannitol/fructose-specific phosphotransferase system IIA component (Ntr-type)